MLRTEVEVCNFTLSHLGNHESIDSIENPISPKEKVFALSFNITRQFCLKSVAPSFAIRRAILSTLQEDAVYGNEYVYAYPDDCLHLLNIGDMSERDIEYRIEGNKIYLKNEYPDGLPVRYVYDETDITKFSPDFLMYFSLELAEVTVGQISQSQNIQVIMKRLAEKKAKVRSLIAQESPPIIVKTSRTRPKSFARRNYTAQ